ncbi:MAG TPA: hypothetical protein VKP69_08460, partial [Isosphaeraceae bacterium]|nr:hypothetical protein [Isosphaeraceae bacterium]
PKRSARIMISIGVGVNVSRWGRLRQFVERRWGERNPDRANRLEQLLRNRYGERKRRRTYSEIVAQEAGRKRRAEDRKVEGRHQFLRYRDLQEVHDDQAEIDLGSLARIAVGVKGANRHEQLFFTDLAQPESLMVLAHKRPPWDQEDGPEQTPGAIQLTLADAYWWCTSGLIAWFDGKWHPLTDEQGQDIRDAEGRPPFLKAYPGPDPGRIGAWRRGADMAAWEQTHAAATPPPEPPEHDMKPEVRLSSPGYLGLILDEKNRLIHREGSTETVELAKKKF